MTAPAVDQKPSPWPCRTSFGRIGARFGLSHLTCRFRWLLHGSLCELLGIKLRTGFVVGLSFVEVDVEKANASIKNINTVWFAVAASNQHLGDTSVELWTLAALVRRDGQSSFGERTEPSSDALTGRRNSRPSANCKPFAWPHFKRRIAPFLSQVINSE